MNLKTFAVAGLILDFIGCILLFCDTWRTNTRMKDNGFTLSYDPKHMSWFWRWCGRVGIVLLGSGFLLQLASYVVD